MHAYYAARAPYYDAVYSKPERRGDIEFLAKHLPQRFSGRQVLEVACGTGYWTQHIAPVAARMVATDGTAEPLEFARLRPAASQVTFLQADAYDLPSTLGTFDAVFAGLWFSHVPIQAREVFLNRLHGHLQPGSRVVFIDNGPVQLRDFPIAETDADGNTYQLRALRDGTVHRVLKNFPSEAELRALLASKKMRVSAATVNYRALENFWLLEYEISSGC
jgi:demethylmenaquinone methyltransferase/2-methoxy-6-polyprenyl-1,4-benzoquinol methylase